MSSSFTVKSWATSVECSARLAVEPAFTSISFGMKANDLAATRIVSAPAGAVAVLLPADDELHAAKPVPRTAADTTSSMEGRVRMERRPYRATHRFREAGATPTRCR